MRLFHALVLVTLVTLASAQVQSRRFVRPSKVKLAVQPAVFVENPIVDTVADDTLASAVVPVPVPAVQTPNVMQVYPRYWPDYSDYGWNAPPWRGSPNWYGWGRRYPYRRGGFVRPTVQDATTVASDVEEVSTVASVTTDA